MKITWHDDGSILIELEDEKKTVITIEQKK